MPPQPFGLILEAVTDCPRPRCHCDGDASGGTRGLSAILVVSSSFGGRQAQPRWI